MLLKKLLKLLKNSKKILGKISYIIQCFADIILYLIDQLGNLFKKIIGVNFDHRKCKLFGYHISLYLFMFCLLITCFPDIFSLRVPNPKLMVFLYYYMLYYLFINR